MHEQTRLSADPNNTTGSQIGSMLQKKFGGAEWTVGLQTDGCVITGKRLGNAAATANKALRLICSSGSKTSKASSLMRSTFPDFKCRGLLQTSRFFTWSLSLPWGFSGYLGFPLDRMAVELSSSSYRSAPDTGNAVCWASNTRRMASRA